MSKGRTDLPRPEPFLDADRRRAQEFAQRMKERLAGQHVPPRLRKLPPEKARPLRHHLVIGDSHAHPDDPNHRFEWLGALIADREPHCVVDIGDSADMPSLFGYEKGNRGPLFEGRRYWEDVEAYIDAQERMFRAMGDFRPGRLVKCQGNHEERIERVLEREPLFRGVIGPENLLEAEFGWEVHPYGEHVEIDGILYTHAFRSPKGGRTIDGVHPTRLGILKIPGSHSRVQGHSHCFQVHEEADSGVGIHGRKITSLHAGCYFDPESNAHRWAGYSVNQWRSGILELLVDDGQIRDLVWTSYRQVRARYG